jgi:hypothetical protein
VNTVGPDDLHVLLIVALLHVFLLALRDVALEVQAAPPGR